MTTIAFKDGIMASDSCWTDVNGWHGTSLTKVVRTSVGALLGGAGGVDARAMEKLLDKVKTFSQMPTVQELADTKTEYHGVIAFPNGDVAQIFCEYDKDSNAWSGGTWRVNRGGTSVGSGSGVALGAMDAGKSAREAVEIACRRDPNSKGPVHVVALKPSTTSSGSPRKR